MTTLRQIWLRHQWLLGVAKEPWCWAIGHDVRGNAERPRLFCYRCGRPMEDW